MHTIFIPLIMNHVKGGQVNFQSEAFKLELQFDVDEKDVMRKILQHLIPILRKKKMTTEQLKQYMPIPNDLPGTILVVPVRIADIIGGKSEKITITMPVNLIAEIDKQVVNSPEHKTRSGFLADAAVKLLMEEDIVLDY